MCVCVCVSGVPSSGAGVPDPAGADEQTVPPSGPGEPHRLVLPPARDGARRQPPLGQPAEESGVHLTPPQGSVYCTLPHSFTLYCRHPHYITDSSSTVIKLKVKVPD